MFEVSKGAKVMDAGRNQDQKEWEKGIRIMMAKMTQSSCTESADQ